MSFAKWTRACFQRLAGLFRKRKSDSEFAAELESHLQLHIEDNLRTGMTPEAARRDALMKLGGVEQTRGNYRDRRGLPFLESFLRDLRFGARMLSKSPAFAFVAILTLALGIGANTAIFSLLNAIMLQSIPVRQPKQLVVLRWSAHSRPENLGTSSYGDCQWVPGVVQSCSFSYPMYRALAAHANAFSDMLAMAGAGPLDLSGNGATSMVDGERVSGNYFETLGVSSALGRTIQPSDDRPDAPRVVVLSYGYWQRAFGGAADAIGRTVRLNGSPFTIVGVIDARFTRLTPGKSTDLWIPLSQDQRSPADDAKDWGLAIIG